MAVPNLTSRPIGLAPAHGNPGRPTARAGTRRCTGTPAPARVARRPPAPSPHGRAAARRRRRPGQPRSGGA
eukprot:1440071-Lingulodinium_polyedra.AAC.1